MRVPTYYGDSDQWLCALADSCREHGDLASALTVERVREELVHEDAEHAAQVYELKLEIYELEDLHSRGRRRC
jgi:hypothetical protein